MTAAPHLSREQMPAQPGRIPSLDGMRAISIFIVLMSHFINSQLFPGGLGVYVFFVISGFLITRLLFTEQKKTGRIELGNFYIRRGLRLYPVAIVFTVLVTSVLIVNRVKFDFIEPMSALFYFANYLYADGRPETAPFLIFWSLSVEEHFYFIMPAVLILAKSPSRLLVVMGIACVTCLLVRCFVALSHPELLSTHHFYYRTECRLDSLAFGVAIACFCELEWGRRVLMRIASLPVFIISIVLILACLLVRGDFFRETFRYTILGFAISGCLCYVLFRPSFICHVLNWKPLVFVGALSYSLYVWHYITFDVVSFFLPRLSRPPLIWILFLASFAFAATSYYGLEKPFMRLRSKLRSKPLEAPLPAIS